jgi:hypothetical protein
LLLFPVDLVQIEPDLLVDPPVELVEDGCDERWALSHI